MTIKVGVELRENVTCTDITAHMTHLVEWKTLIVRQITTVTPVQPEREGEEESTGQITRELEGTVVAENEKKGLMTKEQIEVEMKDLWLTAVRLGGQGKEREVEAENKEGGEEEGDSPRGRGMKKRIFLIMSKFLMSLTAA